MILWLTIKSVQRQKCVMSSWTSPLRMREKDLQSVIFGDVSLLHLVASEWCGV